MNWLPLLGRTLGNLPPLPLAPSGPVLDFCTAIKLSSLLYRCVRIIRAVYGDVFTFSGNGPVSVLGEFDVFSASYIGEQLHTCGTVSCS